MRTNFFGIVGMICASIGIVSTVLYYVLKFRELKLLREIRDRMPKD